MLAETNDPLLKSRLQMRKLALERAVLIENALAEFKQREGRLPDGLVELVTSGDLVMLPEDPYGGRWGILKMVEYSVRANLRTNPPQTKTTKKNPRTS